MTMLFYPAELRPRSYIYTQQDRIDLMNSNLTALPPVLRSAIDPESGIQTPSRTSTQPSNSQEADDPSKPNIPHFYWNWERMIETGSNLVHFNHIDLIPRFRKTAHLTFFIHIAIPLSFLIAFIALEIVFLIYLVWFFWIGFIFLVLIFYRTKDYLELIHYINHPERYLPNLPTYSPGQYSQSMTQLNPPPPNYNQAQSMPPPYVCIS